jgi:hypothetical protein
LVVDGDHFLSGATVHWNGSTRTTTYVGATQLKAAITAADVAVPGTSSVTVVNPPPGGTSSAAVFFIDCENQVSIDAQASPVATIGKDVFGANLTSSMDLTTENANYTTTLSTFRSANFGLVRWPQAAFSDYYHWQTNSFSSCAALNYGPVSRTTFDQFMQHIAQPLGLDVNITINYGSNANCSGGADAGEAAAWVDYANNKMHYGIKYWSIGNEQYYASPTFPTTGPDFNVTPNEPGSAASLTYANRIATEFYPLMKAKDPTIQVGVDLVVPDNNASNRTAPWDSTVLANAKFDFVEVHWYGATPPTLELSDSQLLMAGVSYFASAIQQLQSELAAAGKATTPIYVGEWGIPGANNGSPQDMTIVGALYTALALGEMTRAGIGMAGIWEGLDSGPCIQFLPGDYSRQGWYTSSLFEAIAGGVNPACPLITQPPYGTAFPRANAIRVVQHALNAGDFVVVPSVTGSLANVKAYGTKRGTGYGLLLINSDENFAATTAIAIANDTRRFSATSLLYGKAQYDTSQSNTWTTPVSQNLGTVSSSFSVSLPPWSITAITLEATQ